MILYYGASFTKTWALYKGQDIHDRHNPAVANTATAPKPGNSV